MLNSMTLQDVSRFLDESNYAESTIASYAYTLKRFCEWLDERQIDLASMDIRTLRQFLNNHEWGDNMRRLYGNAIKSFVRWRYGNTHPALAIKLPKDNAAPGRRLDYTQVNQVMAHFDTTTVSGWRDLAIITVMIDTGIRSSEVCSLTLENLRLKARRLSVLAKRKRWQEKSFSLQTAYYLDMWLGARSRVAKPHCPFVFVGVRGKTPGRGMTSSGLRANFRKLGITTEIGKLSPHDLRRTMATLLTIAGAPSRLVQVLGGWEDIRMVERYTRDLEIPDIDNYSPIARINGWDYQH